MEVRVSGNCPGEFDESPNGLLVVTAWSGGTLPVADRAIGLHDHRFNFSAAKIDAKSGGKCGR